MKCFLFVGGLLLLGASGPQRAVAQAPAWQSARAVAAATAALGNNYSDVAATAVDAAGNVYVTGAFKNNVVLGNTPLSSVGGDDVYVAKFSPASNQFVWAQQAGGPGADRANALVVSGGSVYVAGNFGGTTATFGATVLSNVTTNGVPDMFVAKLTDAGATGSFAWAQRGGGVGSDYAYALAVSGTSVYVAGVFTSPTAVFGAVALTNAGVADVYVAKLTDAGATGSFTWAQRAGGPSDDQATALAVSGTSVYVAGYFSGANIVFGTTTLLNAGAGVADVYVAKLTDAGATGSFTWAQRAGGAANDVASALAVNGPSVYVAGRFDSPTAAFGITTLANTTGGANDVFVAKLLDAGTTASYAWAQRAGGPGNDVPYALAVSGSSVLVAGRFDGATAGFGPNTLLNANTGTNDVFVARLLDAGATSTYAWAQRAGGAGQDYALALALSGANVYVAGYFAGASAVFGTTTLANLSPGLNLGFLAALADPTLTATAAGRAVAPTSLFPNPAHGAVALRLPAGTAPAPLTLTDALGRAVRRYPAPAGAEATLDLGGLPAGLYLLRGAGPARRLAVE